MRCLTAVTTAATTTATLTQAVMIAAVWSEPPGSNVVALLSAPIPSGPSNAVQAPRLLAVCTWIDPKRRQLPPGT